jgi:hypothetical protein
VVGWPREPVGQRATPFAPLPRRFSSPLSRVGPARTSFSSAEATDATRGGLSRPGARKDGTGRFCGHVHQSLRGFPKVMIAAPKRAAECRRPAQTNCRTVAWPLNSFRNFRLCYRFCYRSL